MGMEGLGVEKLGIGMGRVKGDYGMWVDVSLAVRTLRTIKTLKHGSTKTTGSNKEL
ncbi:unnamed protein product [Moneuplotes crassus]|uniref:Uncharacterized protein n=1 Tax=Euplotes crassus TaxID=5936 RepID=A0AAD1XD96_EUPCR|nr:unnamed protein product [Moneuplotes crassus]